MASHSCTRRALLVLLPAAGLLLLACRGGARKQGSSLEARRYPLTGRVVAVDADGGAVRIAHEAIPGFMEAMTMRFPVRERSQLAGIGEADAVTATLVVAPDNTYWLEDLKRAATPASP